MCAHYIASRRLQPVQQCALLRTGCAARPKTKTVTADAVFGARLEPLIPGSVLTEERMSYMIGEDAFSSDDRFLAQVRDQDRKVVYQIAGKLIHKGKNHKNDRVRLCVGDAFGHEVAVVGYELAGKHDPKTYHVYTYAPSFEGQSPALLAEDTGGAPAFLFARIDMQKRKFLSSPCAADQTHRF